MKQKNWNTVPKKPNLTFYKLGKVSYDNID